MKSWMFFFSKQQTKEYLHSLANQLNATQQPQVIISLILITPSLISTNHIYSNMLCGTTLELMLGKLFLWCFINMVQKPFDGHLEQMCPGIMGDSNWLFLLLCCPAFQNQHTKACWHSVAYQLDPTATRYYELDIDNTHIDINPSCLFIHVSTVPLQT